MNNPLVSVIMSCYNESDKDLCESIESILNQTYSNFELILVNDNPSNERLRNKLEQYRSVSKVSIIHNKINLGAGKSKNEALKIAKGYYLAILDADDISFPYRLEKEVDYLEKHPECDIVASLRDDIGENSNLLKSSVGIVIKDQYIPKVLKYGAIITHSTVMMKTSILKELQGYRIFKSSQDYDLWLRMVSKKCNFHIIPESLIKYRIRDNGITNSNFAKIYFESNYIRQLFFERERNNGFDSFSEKYFDEIINLPLKKSDPINQQYNQILSLSKNKFQPILLLKIVLGMLTNKDCFINMKNMLLAKILIKIYKK